MYYPNETIQSINGEYLKILTNSGVLLRLLPIVTHKVIKTNDTNEQQLSKVSTGTNLEHTTISTAATTTNITNSGKIWGKGNKYQDINAIGLCATITQVSIIFI